MAETLRGNLQTRQVVGRHRRERNKVVSVRLTSTWRNREVNQALEDGAKASETNGLTATTRKDLLGTKDTDGRGSLVPEGGGQGALFQPEWNRGSLQTKQVAGLFQRKPLRGEERGQIQPLEP